MSPVCRVLAVVLQEGGGKQGLEPGNMLWLIQRDFLQVCTAAYAEPCEAMIVLRSCKRKVSACSF